jgi:hypothetical protein
LLYYAQGVYVENFIGTQLASSWTCRRATVWSKNNLEEVYSMNRHSITSESGMTLLELMFAAGVMAVALSMLFGSMISISAVGEINEDQTIGMTLLSGELEKIRSMPFEDLMDYSPQYIEDGPGAYSGIYLECYDADGHRWPLPFHYRDDVDLPNPLKIRATMIWANVDWRIYTVQLTTQIGR